MYLLHATLLKSILVWIIYGLFPQPWEENNREINPQGRAHTVTTVHNPSYIWTVLGWFVFAAWFAMLLFLCTLWRNYVDTASLRAAKYMEEVVTGKRTLMVRVDTKPFELPSLAKVDESNLENGELENGRA
jgi:hypothetical protein